MTDPTFTITAEQVNALWVAGCLKTSGYLYLYMKAIEQDAWRDRHRTVNQFCQNLGITRRAYYKAKRKLVGHEFITEDELLKVFIDVNKVWGN